MDETSQADENSGTLKIFCISAGVILVGLLALVFLIGDRNSLKAAAQTHTIFETQK